MDIVSYILSKKYTDQTVDGLGAIKGAPCTVQSIVDITDGKRVTLAWESNSGVEQTQSFDIMNGEDGDTIEWNQIQRSGTKIAEVVINGSTTNVYAPNGGGGAGGGHTIIDPAGNDMDQEDGLQFTGNVAVSDDSENGKTVINIPQEVVSLTQAQYNALPSSKLTDGKIYCISDSVGGVDGYPPLIYSDQEREVGVWRDGKPLYQKTLVFQNAQLGRVDCLPHNISDVDFIFVESWEFKQTSLSSSGVIGFESSSSDYWANLFEIASTTISYRIGSGWGAGDLYVNVRYTKTTDTPGSGTWTTYGSYAHHYSTDEHVIGTWIDGKPLYEKTFTNVTGMGGTELLTNVDTVVDFRVSAHGTSPNSSYHCIGDGFTLNSSKIFMLINGVVTYGSWTSSTGEFEKDADFIVVQYTKTTD